MMFETSRGRSALLCHSWQFKLCFVWGGELVSTLTSSILQMGLIWHLALTTGSSSLLSLASLAGFLPIALFGILAGAVVDRLPLKRVLIGADLFIAAVGAALAIASLAGGLPAWLILIALFLRAVGTSFYTPASQSLTPHLAPPEHLVRLSGVTSGDSVRRIHSWRRACSSDLSRGGHYRHDCPRRAGSAFRFSSRPRRADRRRGTRRSRPQLALFQ